MLLASSKPSADDSRFNVDIFPCDRRWQKPVLFIDLQTALLIPSLTPFYLSYIAFSFDWRIGNDLTTFFELYLLRFCSDWVFFSSSFGPYLDDQSFNSFYRLDSFGYGFAIYMCCLLFAFFYRGYVLWGYTAYFNVTTHPLDAAIAILLRDNYLFRAGTTTRAFILQTLFLLSNRPCRLPPARFHPTCLFTPLSSTI